MLGIYGVRDPLVSSHSTVTADECPTRRTAATGWNRTQRRFGVKSQCQGKLESRPTVTRLSLGCLIRRCARAKLVVQLRERYRRLITRGIVTFNFSPRNLTQVTSTMKPGQDSMVGFSSARELLFAKGYIKDRTRIKQPKLNLVTFGRDSNFP